MSTARAKPAGTVDRVRFSPLPQQFAAPDAIFDELKALVASGDFTLGKPVREFEAMFAETLGVKHAIGVGSGTDALKIPLKALGLGPGDEVITAANTFYATAGAIHEVGAVCRFVDCDESFAIDVGQIEAAIGPRTKAIMPVHLTGDVCDMAAVMAIAERHGLPVIEDACQSLMGARDGQRAGTWGVAAGFSMHPLKIINVWGDAGIVVTNDDEMDRKVRLLRNHGLKNRDEMVMLGYNSRLDSLQAVVGKWILATIGDIVSGRRAAAAYYDAGLRGVAGITIPHRQPESRHVYLNYLVFAERRDALLQHCLDRRIEAKVHYPIPLYRQEALLHLGYAEGSFPVTDRHCRTCISFPVDQHVSRAEQDYVIDTVQEFYAGGGR
jgi:dTDP-3-amino-2,3,6-trideoxy-4-keto-D-glucose/dTDP-3-amino-3,4,6-trideoxy-alpha-D-glucose/dTDP-2,6-dideoxy-D-kanosamine transaminase